MVAMWFAINGSNLQTRWVFQTFKCQNTESQIIRCDEVDGIVRCRRSRVGETGISAIGSALLRRG